MIHAFTPFCCNCPTSWRASVSERWKWRFIPRSARVSESQRCFPPDSLRGASNQDRLAFQFIEHGRFKDILVETTDYHMQGHQHDRTRSEEHTSELQSHSFISYA